MINFERRLRCIIFQKGHVIRHSITSCTYTVLKNAHYFFDSAQNMISAQFFEHCSDLRGILQRFSAKQPEGFPRAN